MPADKNKIAERVETAIREKVFPGCVIGVSRNEAVEILPFGRFTYESDSPMVTEKTVYDLASITKSIPTVVLAGIFIAKGKISMSDRVKTYIPEFQNDFDATIEDLLRYRVRGPRMSTLGFKTFEQIRTHIFETGFSGPPGESEYTNLPAYLLGVILERVGGGSLAALSHHYLFAPVHMEEATFFPAKDNCPPTEIQVGEVIQGVPHDESARIFSNARRSTGHAGLFSTAGDLLNCMEAILRGEIPGALEAAEKGLGWTKHSPWFMGEATGEAAFGKTGFTGTSIIAERGRGVLVILSNRTFPTRPPDAISETSAINRFRKDIAEIVYG